MRLSADAKHALQLCAEVLGGFENAGKAASRGADWRKAVETAAGGKTIDKERDHQPDRE